ncbi:carboxypeptidase inhibitor [Ixodes scapularis]|uniref:carboxypeptidase inhibitor n=1 Tax=Ixodes scapularis TaxID=6945 RepID=UPI0011618CF2|nr:carboxypeptidase inhibitor [Ixodes scapularis]
MAPTAVLLLLVSTFLLLEFSQGNECVAAGYGCVPERVCPRQHIKRKSGCSTVCCDLANVKTCAARGGECSPAQTNCKEAPELAATCGPRQKCCIYV